MDTKFSVLPFHTHQNKVATFGALKKSLGAFLSSNYKWLSLHLKIHFTAELCSCIVRGLFIHFHWQTTPPKNTRRANLGEEQRMSFSPSWTDSSTVGVHIITALTLLTITYLSRCRPCTASPLSHSTRFLKAKRENRWMTHPIVHITGAEH